MQVACRIRSLRQPKSDTSQSCRWSPEHPQLYVLRTTLRTGGKSEMIETHFGFREFRAD
jgi:beta-galactosidase/beta-glucuronidase